MQSDSSTIDANAVNPCVICGDICGPLQGETHSWPCAGKLSHQQRERRIRARRDEMRARYSSVDKAAARNAMRDDVVALAPAPRILDLYGGGLSAEWFRRERPDAEIVVAERDRSLWPALRRDADAFGLMPVYGDFTKAPGVFDFVYLDLCAEPLGAYAATSSLIPLLRRRIRNVDWFYERYRPDETPMGVYVTVLRQNRQGYSELRREGLEIAVRALLDSATGAWFQAATLVHSYPQSGGKGLVDLWRLGPSAKDQRDAIAEAIRDHERDSNYHRNERENFYRGYPHSYSDNRGYVQVYGASHARGTCRCADRGYITFDEQLADRQRFSAWSAAGNSIYRRRPDTPNARALEAA